MRSKAYPVLLSAGMVLLLALLGLYLTGSSPRHPSGLDLSHWLPRAQSQDWAALASAGDAEAQFLQGLRLLRPELVFAIDRVPILSSVPFFGRRWFERRSVMMKPSADPALVAEAQRWIEQSAAQNFRPAKDFLGVFASYRPLPSTNSAAVLKSQ